MQSINTGSPAETTQAPAGHDEAMAAKFDAVQTPTEQQTQATPEERPQWLPEKFKSPEDLAKAYAELEKKSSTPKAPTEEPKKEGLQITPEEAKPEETKEGLAAVGIDYDALSAKFAEKGTLDDADYELLQSKAGLSRELVDSYIEAQKSQAQVIELSVKTQFGGEDGWNAMAEWAGKNLSAGELEAFNKVMDSGDLEQIKLVAGGLHTKFTNAVGSEPKLVNGGTTAPSNDVFRSTAELTLAMQDPRYAKDEAYRQDVMAKLSRSSIM